MGWCDWLGTSSSRCCRWRGTQTARTPYHNVHQNLVEDFMTIFLATFKRTALLGFSFLADDVPDDEDDETEEVLYFPWDQKWCNGTKQHYGTTKQQQTACMHACGTKQHYGTPKQQQTACMHACGTKQHYGTTKQQQTA